MARFAFHRLSLLLLVVLPFFSGRGLAAELGPAECQANSDRATWEPLVELRTETVPDLPRHGIQIKKGESLCVLVNECRGRFCELNLARSTNAAALRFEWRETSGGASLVVDNYQDGPFIFKMNGGGDLLAPQAGRSEFPLHAVLSGETPREKLLISHLMHDSGFASAGGARNSSRYGDAWSRRDSYRNENAPQFAIGFPVLQMQRLHLAALNEDLRRLGYVPLSESIFALGGATEAKIGSFYMGLSTYGHRQALHFPNKDAERVRGQFIEVAVGWEIVDRKRLVLDLLLGLGDALLSLQLPGGKAPVPDWAKRQRDLEWRGGFWFAGLRSDYHFASDGTAALALRTEVGGKLPFSGGRWGYMDDDEYKKLGGGPSLYVATPYFSIGLVGRLFDPFSPLH